MIPENTADWLIFANLFTCTEERGAYIGRHICNMKDGQQGPGSLPSRATQGGILFGIVPL
jgi:hypothetical protein